MMSATEETKDGGGARRMLSLEQILKLLPVGKSTLKRMIKRGDFPQPHYLSPNKQVWYEDDIELWQEGLPVEDQRRKPRGRDKGGRMR